MVTKKVVVRSWEVKKKRKSTSFAEDIQRQLEDHLARKDKGNGTSWPSEYYATRPIKFCKEILGFDPWRRQREMLRAMVKHTRVGVASGQKTGKTRIIAAIALWWFCTRKHCQVIITSTTERQVNLVIWREVRLLALESGICVECRKEGVDERPCPHSAVIPEVPRGAARVGLRGDGGRVIVGLTAREPEALQGISGANNLYLLDEASGINDLIYEAIRGNLSGGGSLLLVSNPTRNTGFFYRAFHEAASNYYTMRISSLESPNVKAGRMLVPGLATAESIRDLEIEYGKESSLYAVRVLGEFVTKDNSGVFSVEAIGEAQSRWDDTEPSGRLFVGVDPAGASGTGDETAIAIRRGKKLLELNVYSGLSAEQHLGQVMVTLAQHREPGELPVVVLDREGPIGAEVYGHFRNFVHDNPRAFSLSAIRCSERSQLQGSYYDRVRDELSGNFERWLKDGGAILHDKKLEREMFAMVWTQDIRGRVKVTPKDKLRKVLGRSPDRYDAVTLACFETEFVRREHDLAPPSPQEKVVRAHEMQQKPFDFYSAVDSMTRQGRR